MHTLTFMGNLIKILSYSTSNRTVFRSSAITFLFSEWGMYCFKKFCCLPYLGFLLLPWQLILKTSIKRFYTSSAEKLSFFGLKVVGIRPPVRLFKANSFLASIHFQAHYPYTKLIFRVIHEVKLDYCTDLQQICIGVVLMFLLQTFPIQNCVFYL